MAKLSNTADIKAISAFWETYLNSIHLAKYFLQITKFSNTSDIEATKESAVNKCNDNLLET